MLFTVYSYFARSLQYFLFFCKESDHSPESSLFGLQKQPEKCKYRTGEFCMSVFSIDYRTA